MKSVDKLRELGSQYHDRIIFFKEEFDKCLDAIEEEGRTRYGTEYTDELYQFARRVEEAANDRDDVTLFGVDYMPCPLDSNGTPIHIGDDVKVVGYDNGNVASIDVRDDGTAYVGVRPYGWDTATVHRSDNIIHSSAPTVEDVLREFYVLAVRGKEAHAEDVDADVLTEYAAKLRLAGEDA